MKSRYQIGSVVFRKMTSQILDYTPVLTFQDPFDPLKKNFKNCEKTSAILYASWSYDTVLKKNLFNWIPFLKSISWFTKFRAHFILSVSINIWPAQNCCLFLLRRRRPHASRSLISEVQPSFEKPFTVCVLVCCCWASKSAIFILFCLSQFLPDFCCSFTAVVNE